MRNDAINMEVNEGLLAFGAEEEGAVFGASAGQIEPFLPLGCSLWGLRVANRTVFAPCIK